MIGTHKRVRSSRSSVPSPGPPRCHDSLILGTRNDEWTESGNPTNTFSTDFGKPREDFCNRTGDARLGYLWYGIALACSEDLESQRRSLEYICTYGMLRRCKENHNIWCSVQNKEHTKGHLQNLKCAHQSLRYLKLSY